MQELCKQKLNNRKIIVIVCLGILAVSTVLLLILPTLHASLAGNVLASAMESIELIFHTRMSAEATNILINSRLWNDTTLIGYLIHNLMIVTKSIAAALFMVRIMIEVVQEFSNGEFGLDPFLKLLVRMAITMTLILEIDTAIVVVQQLMYNPDTHQGVLIEVQNSIGLDAMHERFMESLTQIQNMQSSGGSFLEAIGYIFSIPRILIDTLVVKLFNLIISGLILIIVKISCYTLVIEFTIRRVFMPVAVVSLMEDGMRGPGMKFIKRTVGLFIRMMITIISFGVADVMMYQVMENVVNNYLSGTDTSLYSLTMDLFMDSIKTSTVFLIAASSFARKGGNLADEIIGV